MSNITVKPTMQMTKEDAEVFGLYQDSFSQIDSSDIKIPKILLMQGMSEKVTSGEAQMGDLVSSISGEVIGSCREKGYKPVQIIPIDMYKTWIIYETTGGMMEYVETVPESINTASWRKEYEFTKDGRTFKRVHNLNFYVLLTSDIGNPLAMPHVVTFRSTSYTVGTVISNHFANCLRAFQKGVQMFPPSLTFELGGELIKDDKGTYYKFSVKPAGKTSDEGIKDAFSWLKTIKASKANLVVDESEVVESADEKTVSQTAKFSHKDLEV